MLVSDNLIEVSNLRKSYGQGDNRVDVLKGIDCKIKRGSICTLLGPSGSGKSTFLNILGGIESFEEGSLIVDGLELKNLSKKDLLQYRRDKLGFVFQFYNLVSNLTLKENIEVGAYLSKDPLDLDDLIEKLGLVDHQSKFPNQLSGGQQQRTAIARALSKSPTILLCDEPTGALDYSTAKDVLKMIQKINKEYKSTIIIATHNTAIAGMSHEVLSLHDGTIMEHRINDSIVDASELVW
nr:ABC transporter ATP-binding protein [uncultured Peptostreptococcus sp.]